MLTVHDTARRNTAGRNDFGTFPNRHRRKLTPAEKLTQLLTGTARKGGPPPIPSFPAKAQATARLGTRCRRPAARRLPARSELRRASRSQQGQSNSIVPKPLALRWLRSRRGER